MYSLREYFHGIQAFNPGYPFLLPNQFYILNLWSWLYHQIGHSGISDIYSTIYVMIILGLTESSGIWY
jgi:hypothetical protein